MKKEFIGDAYFKGKKYLVEMPENCGYISKIYLIAKNGYLLKRNGNDFTELAKELNKNR